MRSAARVTARRPSRSTGTSSTRPAEAIKLAKDTTTVKFDPTVEVAMRLGVDPRKADQMVRGTVNLPHGTGKTARVIVFAAGAKAAEADAAGADVVGTDELVARIQEGWLDFDAAIATPDQMAKIGRIARILGPRGLMPNPKTGTVTMDVTKAVNEIKGGKITFRVDKHSNLHLIIGKASFSRGAAGRQLRRGPRRGPARQAVGVEGQVPPQGHRHHHHGPGRPGRPERRQEPARDRGLSFPLFHIARHPFWGWRAMFVFCLLAALAVEEPCRRWSKSRSMVDTKSGDRREPRRSPTKSAFVK